MPYIERIQICELQKYYTMDAGIRQMRVMKGHMTAPFSI